MSLDHTSGAPDGVHLDEEAVSGALDDHAGADELAHLERCATCRASLDRLRVAQVAVAAPVPLDSGAREAALAAALGAFDDARAEAPHIRQATPIAVRPGRPAGRWRRTGPSPWLGIAAVVLLVVLAVPLLRGAGGGPGESQGAGDSAEMATGEGGGESGVEEEASASAAAPPVDVGDLGAIAVGEDLRPVVDAALGPGPDEATTSEERAGATPDAGGDGDESEGAVPDEGTGSDGGGAPGEAEESAPEPSTAPGTLARPEGVAPRAGAEEDAFQEARATCEPTVRAALPEAGALVLVGSATIDGAPALVFGFTGLSERPAVLTALVRREGCELVTFQSYVRG